MPHKVHYRRDLVNDKMVTMDMDEDGVVKTVNHREVIKMVNGVVEEVDLMIVEVAEGMKIVEVAVDTMTDDVEEAEAAMNLVNHVVMLIPMQLELGEEAEEEENVLNDPVNL